MEQRSVNPRQLRLRRRLSQSAFWGKIGITQSGGSRYESRQRALPKTIVLLLMLAHGGHTQSLTAYQRLRAA